jgi:hypothetical protein
MIDNQGFEVKGTLKKGQQIVYCPPHLSWMNIMQWGDGNYWSYPNGYQPGFVTSGPTHPVEDSGARQEENYFCRYWRYDNHKKIYVPELRTVSNSELTPSRCIVVMDFFIQMHVDWFVKELCV